MNHVNKQSEESVNFDLEEVISWLLFLNVNFQHLPFGAQLLLSFC